MSDWLTIVLALGLTARLIRLTVYDDAGVLVRAPVTFLSYLVLRQERGGRFARDLLGCPFCVGFWIALAVAVTWGLWSDQLWWQVAALAGTGSYVAGHLAATLDD